jgi:hypothetical protein
MISNKGVCDLVSELVSTRGWLSFVDTNTELKLTKVPRHLGASTPRQGIWQPDGGAIGTVDESHFANGRYELHGSHKAVFNSVHTVLKEIEPETSRRTRVFPSSLHSAILFVWTNQQPRALLSDVAAAFQVAQDRQTSGQLVGLLVWLSVLLLLLLL